MNVIALLILNCLLTMAIILSGFFYESVGDDGQTDDSYGKKIIAQTPLALDQ